MPKTNKFCCLLRAGLLSIAFSLAPQMVQAFELDQLSIKDTEISIDNFGRVSPLIWRGGVPSDQALEQLAGRGVKTVIDLRYDGAGCKHEEQSALRLGLKYVHLSIGFNRPEREEIISFLKIVSNPINLPVFIHCRQGADRTGTLVGIYRVFIQDWTFTKTYKEMRAYHFKPWLFGMKKRVATVATDDITRQAIKVALNNQSGDIAISSMP